MLWTDEKKEVDEQLDFELPLDMDPKQIKNSVMANDLTKKYTDGKQVVKVIVVQKKIVNIVVNNKNTDYKKCNPASFLQRRIVFIMRKI